MNRVNIRQNASIFEEKSFSRLVSRWMKDTNGDTKFLSGSFSDDGTIWIARESELLVIDTETGEKIAHFRFRPSFLIECAVPFLLAGNRRGLLIGACSGMKYVVCCLDVIGNRLVSATAVPHQILTLCVIMDGNRQSAAEDRAQLHPDLKQWSSLIAIGTVRGHVYLYDIAFDDKATSNEICPRVREVYCTEDNFSNSNGLLEITDTLRHSEKSIQWPDGERRPVEISAATTAVTALYYAKEAHILSIGFNFGGVLLYSLDSLAPVNFSPYEPNAAAVMQFELIEPEEDPRPTLYLWALRDNKACTVEENSCGTDAPSLEMYQLSFRERISTDVGNLYSELTFFVSRMYWVPDTCSTLLNCTTLSTWVERPCEDGSTPLSSRSFLYFFWITKTGKMIGCLFDVNSWYHAQMPKNVFSFPEYHVCPYVAWHFYGDANDYCGLAPLVCSPIERSVIRNRQIPDTQFNYFACSYSLNVDIVTQNGVKHYFVADIQNLVLDQITGRGIQGILQPGELFSLLQSAKLVPFVENDCSEDQMRRHLWTTMLENGRLHYLTNCFLSSISTHDWLLEEFVQWAWFQSVVSKDRLDVICGSLFSGRAAGLDDTTKRMLQKEARNLELLLNAHSFCRALLGMDPMSRGGTKLGVREIALQETCLFTKVILWFVEAGILPEKGFYDYESIKRNHRMASGQAMREGRTPYIDELASELNRSLEQCPVEGFDGPIVYPLTTFRDVLSVYLIPNADVIAKHAFVFYTLLDLVAVDDMDEEIPKKFAKDVLPTQDRFLGNFASILWNIDNGNSQAASRHAVDALVTLPNNSNARNRLACLLAPSNHHSLTSSNSLAMVLPNLSLDQQDQPFRRRKMRPCVEPARDKSLMDTTPGGKYSISARKPTPMKRRAADPDSPDTVAAKRSRRYLSTVMETPRDDESQSLHLEACFDEARSLLKAPSSDNSSVSRPTIHAHTTPVSILRSNRRREKDQFASPYMEKSLRFSLPTENEDRHLSLDSSTTSPQAVNEVPSTSAQSNIRTYQSPSDEEITLVYSRHRWSLAGVPSPDSN